MMQDSLLLPWRTLEHNATLGCEITGGKPWDARTVAELFGTFGLAPFRHHLPDTASAGMRQRVALIRTLLLGSNVLLLDEPFSNLDYDIKLLVQRYLLNYQRTAEATICLVTHDIDDAIALSDRVVILSDQPTTVKAELSIGLGLTDKDPVKARKSDRFRDYFVEIISHLKYLNDNA